MKHQSGRKKLNLPSPHRKAMIRNQVISLITYGHLVTTKARVKEVRRVAEKLVTLARKGKHFNNIRCAKAILPYKEEAIVRLFDEIAPRYVNRPGGYTRIIPLGKRVSDTATIARLEWVM
ncbi:50S ribosomal protein L17 [Candidatus Babela massiliensis]|uniref:50S ribosomal protein L17 n=1 Tax=Candidatus Babela massiliensis TaxID=673862 RepID=V6DG04_9BACT|nr:50S ribosomal protein L17 [Candidatus Babela massiliensis]CDK30485.1 ribosomal protein L17 [Candidatus Babela massiliensis]